MLIGSFWSPFLFWRLFHNCTVRGRGSRRLQIDIRPACHPEAPSSRWGSSGDLLLRSTCPMQHRNEASVIMCFVGRVATGRQAPRRNRNGRFQPEASRKRAWRGCHRRQLCVQAQAAEDTGEDEQGGS
eukprot:4151460-Pyramimonas_sp.AAC.1